MLRAQRPSRCVCFYSFRTFFPNSPEWFPPVQGTSRTPAPGSSQDPVSSRSRSWNDSNTVPVSVSIIHLFKSLLQVLYTQRMGSEYLRPLQTSWRGWADSKAVHSMECRGGRARSTGGLSLSRGCCLRCTVLPALGGVLPQARTNSQRTKQQTD